MYVPCHMSYPSPLDFAKKAPNSCYELCVVNKMPELQISFMCRSNFTFHPLTCMHLSCTLLFNKSEQTNERNGYRRGTDHVTYIDVKNAHLHHRPVYLVHYYLHFSKQFYLQLHIFTLRLIVYDRYLFNFRFKVTHRGL